MAQNGHKEIVWASTTLAVLNADGTAYSSAWPKVQTANPGQAQGQYGAIVLADVDGDGKPEIVTTTTNGVSNSNPFFVYPSYLDQKLLAFHLDGTIVRSWQLTGMNGYDSYTSAVPSIGDFSGQGTNEIAVAYFVSGPGGLTPGVVSILETGVPYNTALTPWPYVYSNLGNNPVLGAGTSSADITVATNPSDLSIIVDGISYTAPHVFDWTGGTSHTVNVSSPQGGAGTRYIFANWSDGGNASHSISAPASPSTYTANFTTQYLLTSSASPGAGTVAANPTAADGYYNSGTSVQLTALPASGCAFSNFTGDLTGGINPQTIVMSAPRSVTANFVCTYTVGDVFPFTADTAPNFGDGALTIQDLIQVLFAVNNVPGFRPAACSDRFDAMDLFPVDVGATRGGDGLLDIRDLILELFRVNNLDLDRPVRASRGGVCGGGASPTAAGPAAATRNIRPPGAAQGALVLGEAEKTADGSERIPIYLEASRDLVRVAVTFALGDQRSQLRFVSTAATPPSLAQDSQVGVIAVAWLEGVSVRPGERFLLGYAAGPAGTLANLRVYGISASGLDDNREVRLEASTRAGR